MITNIPLTSDAPVSATRQIGTTNETGNPSRDGVIKLDQIQIGKALQAQVTSILNNGNSIVSIQNGAQTSSLQVHLPSNLKVGDQLQLTLLSLNDGKPNFSISLLNATETVNLSSTAQLLDKLALHNNQQAKVNGYKPLLASTKELEPAHLATQLGASIEKSGVFYESHLQQWSEGNRNLEQIKQEPQNQSTTPTETANTLIPAQLDSLENKRLSWQGELFPGQPLQMDITKEDIQGKQSSASSSSRKDSEAIWQTSLKLQLPNLGDVHVKIRLQGDHAQLNVNVNDSATATSLKSASDSLAQLLAASGTALDQITVQSDDKTQS